MDLIPRKPKPTPDPGPKPMNLIQWARNSEILHGRRKIEIEFISDLTMGV